MNINEYQMRKGNVSHFGSSLEMVQAGAQGPFSARTSIRAVLSLEKRAMRVAVLVHSFILPWIEK